MRNFHQTGLIKAISFLIIFTGLISIGMRSVQSKPLDKLQTLWSAPPFSSRDKGQVIPPSSAPPPSDPTLSRTGHCSKLMPRVLLPQSEEMQLPQSEGTSPNLWIRTTAAYPTFLLYLPPTTAKRAEFLLKTTDEKVIYRKLLILSQQPGIVRIAVPPDQSIPAIAPGTTYQWEFNVICDPQDRVNDDFVSGQLARSPLSPEQLAKLTKASLREQLVLFQAADSAYDVGVVLDALHREAPLDQNIQTTWEGWLQKYQFGALKGVPAIDLK